MLWPSTNLSLQTHIFGRKGPSPLRTSKVDSHPRISISQLAVPFGKKTKTIFFSSFLPEWRGRIAIPPFHCSLTASLHGDSGVTVTCRVAKGEAWHWQEVHCHQPRVRHHSRNCGMWEYRRHSEPGSGGHGGRSGPGDVTADDTSGFTSVPTFSGYVRREVAGCLRAIIAVPSDWAVTTSIAELHLDGYFTHSRVWDSSRRPVRKSSSQTALLFVMSQVILEMKPKVRCIFQLTFRIGLRVRGVGGGGGRVEEEEFTRGNK